jgi:hypothetical protein
MKTTSLQELALAFQTISHLASNGNRLAQSLLVERTHIKQNHISERHDGFSLVFYYKPHNSASWGTHNIRFEGKSITNSTPAYSFEQHQIKFLNSEVSVYQNFMKEFFELLTALTEDYRTRNPIEEIDYSWME